jgi:hypothetical protein
MSNRASSARVRTCWSAGRGCGRSSGSSRRSGFDVTSPRRAAKPNTQLSGTSTPRTVHGDSASACSSVTSWAISSVVISCRRRPPRRGSRCRASWERYRSSVRSRRSPAATLSSNSLSQRAATSANVDRGETASARRRPSALSSSRSLRASASVAAETVRKRGLPSIMKQTAYLPFGCR